MKSFLFAAAITFALPAGAALAEQAIANGIATPTVTSAGAPGYSAPRLTFVANSPDAGGGSPALPLSQVQQLESAMQQIMDYEEGLLSQHPQSQAEQRALQALHTQHAQTLQALKGIHVRK